MGRQWVCPFRAWTERFAREQQGNVALTFAIALVPVISSVGGAVDYSRANAIKTGLQAAADATSLMAYYRPVC